MAGVGGIYIYTHIFFRRLAGLVRVLSEVCDAIFPNDISDMSRIGVYYYYSVQCMTLVLNKTYTYVAIVAHIHICSNNGTHAHM